MAKASLSDLAKRVAETFNQRNQFLVLVESCTGGLASAALVGIPGASDWFCGGLVTYRDQSKQHWLGIAPEVLHTHTDVSLETTRAMAAGALNQTPEADWSAAITGHFGPGAPEDVDGWMHLAVARRDVSGAEVVVERSEKLKATGRTERQEEAATALLSLCFETVSENE